MALFSGNIDDLRSLYTNQLRLLLSTEKQIIDALPKMVDAATDVQLKHALQTHLQETEAQKLRLDEILHDLTGDDDDKDCDVTDELISAGETIVKAAKDDAVRDAGIISAAQKIEHFEIASYGSVREWAFLLGETDHANLLQTSLNEEKNADRIITEVSQQRNPEAAASISAA
jgi:ferritin-like metal-binding protein YciE